MALGDKAKDNVTKRIVGAFGEEYVGIKDKKIYVEMKDGTNGYVQIAISLTAVKNPIEKQNKISTEIIEDYDWSEPTLPKTEAPPAPKIQSEDEKETIAEMLAAFGL